MRRIVIVITSLFLVAGVGLAHAENPAPDIPNLPPYDPDARATADAGAATAMAAIGTAIARETEMPSAPMPYRQILPICPQ